MWIWKFLSSFQNTLRLFISPIANVNDRSMLGCRDSEIAVYVQDNAMVRIFGLIKKERKKVHWNKKDFEWIIPYFHEILACPTRHLPWVSVGKNRLYDIFYSVAFYENTRVVKWVIFSWKLRENSLSKIDNKVFVRK